MTNWQDINENLGGAHSYLIEYYNKCKHGEKLIGQELMTALDGYIADMDCAEYRFSLVKPHKRIKFIESRIKHFESPFTGKPFILTLEQKAITEALFGFEYYDPEYEEWVRRFKEMLLLIGRKNGKTPFIAALVLAEWFCAEAGQKVMCASNDYEQASIIFDYINNFREENAAIEKVTRKNNFGIFFGNPRQRRKRGKRSKQNKGNIKKMSAKTGAKEGRNLKIIVVDEIHEMKDRTTVMPLESSLTTQKEPLYIEITTEGIVTDGYLDERLRDARKVLRGEEKNPRWLIWLYTQDSEAEVWSDEKTWVKSNPMLGTVKKWSELRARVDKARASNAERAFTLAKEFNIKSSRPNAWLEDKYIITKTAFDLDDFRGCWCIGAGDLGETNDLASCTLLFIKPNDRTKYLHTMYFVPKSKAIDPLSTESPTNPERRNYEEWAAAGLCRIVDANAVPDDAVALYFLEIYKKYNIRPYRVGFDAWHAKEFSKIIDEKFGKGVAVKISMTTPALNVPTRTLEADLRAGYVNYNSNPICLWNFRNAALRLDHIGQVMPIKLQGYTGNKIDGTMTKVIAYATLRQFKTPFEHLTGVKVYE